MRIYLALLLLCAGASLAEAYGQAPLRIVRFEAAATPPVGTPMAYMPIERIDDSLRVKGLVLLSEEAPIVLCALDWIGISNGGQDAWRMALAEAAGTSPDRVAVHALHQHDAPAYDADAELILLAHGVDDQGIDHAFARTAIRGAARALREAMARPAEVTHLGLGKARVERVASNRRILGPDGHVVLTRWSATRDSVKRSAPEGISDPYVRAVSFWREEEPLAVLTYYATHPQSYYREGGASSDFVGIARDLRQRASGLFQVHFNGAGGNITAGKYNDGSHANRPVLARRLAEGMAAAWAATEKQRIRAADVGWAVRPVVLPLAERLQEATLVEALAEAPDMGTARALAWVRRNRTGVPLLLSALRLGDARILHMPGELFIEYQLAAQAMRPDLFVAMAAYGDTGPGYIGTRVAYGQGGYETGRVSRVAPEVEAVLTEGMRALLAAPPEAGPTPSEITLQSPRFTPPEPAGAQ